MSSAGTITIAAASGRWIPSAATTAVAAARRAPAESEGPAGQAEGAARVDGRGRGRRRAGGTRVGLAAAGDERDADGGRDEADRDQERPERHDAGGSAGDDERAEDDRAGGAERRRRRRRSSRAASRFGSARAKRPIRTASPARAGTKVLTSEPAP